MPSRHPATPPDQADLAGADIGRQRLRDATARPVRDHLIPLLARSPAELDQQTGARLAATLALDQLILPLSAGGAGASGADLYAVVEQLAHGPLELAVRLSLSVPCLLLLRSLDASLLPDPGQMAHLFDGTESLSLTVPGAQPATLWRLQMHEGAPGVALNESGRGLRPVRIEHDGWTEAVTHRVRVARSGPLTLERLQLNNAVLAQCQPLRVAVGTGIPGQAVMSANPRAGLPVEAGVTAWLLITGHYLCALLTGMMQQAAAFALDYTTGRQAFRRPLAAQQLVATRLSDLVTAAHVATLFARSASVDVQSVDVQAGDAGDLAVQLFHHIAAAATSTSHDLVQICGGHGYVHGLPAATWLEQIPLMASLLLCVADALCRARASGRDAATSAAIAPPA